MPADSEQSFSNSIFQTPWWLDAVAPGQWAEIVVKRSDQVAARLPYVVKKKYGLTALTHPPLTQTLGPWLRPSTAKYANQLKEQKDLMEELIAGLPKFDSFVQNFSPQITNWLPFYWEGFQSELRYTYQLRDLTDPKAIWENFRDNIRTDVRKAERQLKVTTERSLDDFIRLLKMTFARQGKELPYDESVVRRIDRACGERDQRRIFFAEDAQGRLHAAIFLIWDKHSAYYLMGGSDPELRNSGATSLLLWHAIQFSAGVTSIFDFEGSMLEPVERFVRAFGALQVPYVTVRKNNRRMQLIQAARDFSSALLRNAN